MKDVRDKQGRYSWLILIYYTCIRLVRLKKFEYLGKTAGPLLDFKMDDFLKELNDFFVHW